MAESLPIIQLIIFAVALLPVGYLLTLFVTKTDGPFGVFLKLRWYAGIRAESFFDERGNEFFEDQSDGSFFAEVLSCHRCTTPYATAGAIILFVIFGLIPISFSIIPLWAIVSGLVLFMFEATNE